MSILIGNEMCRLQRHGENKQYLRNYIQAHKFDNEPNRALIFRRANEHDDPSTEMSNEIGTTDQVVGEPLIEEMLTTPGKIPNEMYELENTPPTPEATSILARNAPVATKQTLPAYTKGIVNINESSVAEPSIILIIGVMLGILLFFGCIIVWAISRVKKNNYKQLNKKDVECNAADCPLLSTCKRKDSSTSICCSN